MQSIYRYGARSGVRSGHSRGAEGAGKTKIRFVRLVICAGLFLLAFLAKLLLPSLAETAGSKAAEIISRGR
jgi:hypothetical protein